MLKQKFVTVFPFPECFIVLCIVYRHSAQIILTGVSHYKFIDFSVVASFIF